MSDCIITKYLTYKKSRLITYGKIIFSDIENLDFLTSCYEKYITNYIEVYYYHIFSTIETSPEIISQEILKEEQTGIQLEELDHLKEFELIDSNEQYQRKKQLIHIAKDICFFLANLDRVPLIDKNELDNQLLVLKEDENIKELLTEEVVRNLKNEIMNTIKTEQKLVEENSIFSIKEINLTENLTEVKIEYYSKKLQTNYKKSLVERVYHQEEILEKKTILLVKKILLEVLRALISKKEIKHYIIEVEDNIFSNKDTIKEMFSLLDDNLAKENIILGISYDQYSASRFITEKYKEQYHFACYQDFTYINDYNAKFTNIENAQVFDYIVVTGYKDKEYEWLKKYTPAVVKEVLFSKEV